MNVLIFSETFYPEGRGGELATYLYAKLLSENGISVRVITTSSFSASISEATDKLIIYRVPVRKPTKYFIPKVFLLLREPLRNLLKWSDIVYMTGWLPIMPLIRDEFKKPIVVHLHSSFPACPIGTSYDLIEDSPCNLNISPLRCSKCIALYERSEDRKLLETIISSLLNSTIGLTYANLLRYSDAVVFVSNYQKNLVLRRVPSVDSKAFVIHNPLPKLPYTPIIGNDLGYFGGISLLKGFHILMRAWLKVYNKCDEKLHVSLAEKIFAKKRLFEKVKISLHGKLSGNKYDEVYRSIKAVLFPSIIPEALPYVVSEACLRGRIVITSRVGGVTEIVEDLKGVFVVEPNDVNGLADALDQVLSLDKREAVELGMSNREDILRKFDNDRQISKLIRIFEEVSS